MKNFLILCPLAIELESILARLREKNFSFREEQVGPLKVFHVLELNLILGLAGHGKTLVRDGVGSVRRRRRNSSKIIWWSDRNICGFERIKRLHRINTRI